LTNTSSSYSGGTGLRFGRISLGGDVPATGARLLGTGAGQLGDPPTNTSGRMSPYLQGGLTFRRNHTTNATRPRQRPRSATAPAIVGVDAPPTGAGATFNGDFTWGATGAGSFARRASLTAVQADAALTVNGRLATTSGGDLLYINGANSGAGTVKLTHTDNAFAGLTVVNGSLVVGASVAAASGNSVVGTGSVTLADGNTTAEATVRLVTDGAFTLTRPIALATAASNRPAAAYVVGTTAASGTANFLGNISVPTASASHYKLQLTAASGGTADVSGLIGPNPH